MAKHIILGVHITDRLEHALPVQQVLTEFGGIIKTRLGLHELGKGGASARNGLLLLELAATEAKAAAMVKKLGAIKGIEVQKMVFAH
ncbi:MAG TPA: hypothetical protein PLE19_10025 [Planctomycetota bacterium]|nr:hypothetical protein [Planctomycetota bacterium]HRR82176.1 hypothetical protein [Planctomycetota bacterium]HRT93882.1 hypothetical protein [Planctomycetota bacterium]